MLWSCDVGEDSWESLDCKSVNPKGNKPWLFTGGPILWPLDAKSQLIGKTLMLGKIEGRRRREWQRIRWLDSIIDSMGMSLRKLQEIVKDRGDWYAGVQGVAKSHIWLSDWRTNSIIGLRSWLIGKQSNYQCTKCGFKSWVGKDTWRRKWQLTPVFLPGKLHRQRSLVGYSPWGCQRVGHDSAAKQ